MRFLDNGDGGSLIFTKDPSTGNAVMFIQNKSGQFDGYAVLEPGKGNPSVAVNFVTSNGTAVDGTRGFGQSQPPAPQAYYHQLLGK